MKEQDGGRSEEDGEQKEWNISEVNTISVYKGQNELIGELKMATGDVISVRVGIS